MIKLKSLLTEARLLTIQQTAKRLAKLAEREQISSEMKDLIANLNWMVNGVRPK